MPLFAVRPAPMSPTSHSEVGPVATHRTVGTGSEDLAAERSAAEATAGVQYQSRMLGDVVVRQIGVSGEDHDQIGRLELRNAAVDTFHLRAEARVVGNVGVVGPNLGPELRQPLGDRGCRRLAPVGGAGLVGETDEQDA